MLAPFVASLARSGRPAGLTFLLALAFGSPAAATQSDALSVPRFFVQNTGAVAGPVSFFLQGRDKTFYYAPDGISIALRDATRRWAVKIDFVGATRVAPRGFNPLPTRISFFRGARASARTASAFGGLRYPDLWPGIDLVLRGTARGIKYEFVCAPGADPRCVRLRYRGATEVAVDADGSLRVVTPVNTLRDAAPIAFQPPGEDRDDVPIAFETQSFETHAEVRFRVGDYDRTRPLILDPAVLVYCGYIGGRQREFAADVVVDAAGSAYVAGSTDSLAGFPAQVGPDVGYNGGFSDCFVAKLNAAGTGLVYAGYIGGAGLDAASAIAVNAAGELFVAGATDSTAATFPVTVGPSLTPSGKNEGFIAKIDASGTRLLYCGYLGGSEDDAVSGIAIDPAGRAHVCGTTWSGESTFPVAVGPTLVHQSWNAARPRPDAFVARINANGTGLDYCGYIGGTDWDEAGGISLDASGHAYVAGMTRSPHASFPATVGPDTTWNGSSDAFVAKVSPTGSALAYCGYIGGWSGEAATAIDVDASGRAYVAGYTYTPEGSFPVRGGPDLTYNGAGDGFVAVVDATGRTLERCGYVGGLFYDTLNDLTLGPNGAVYVCGTTFSDETSLPVWIGPDLTFNGTPQQDVDAFVARIDPVGRPFVFCGYIGGGASDLGTGIALDRTGNVYVTGYTSSNETTFPVVVGPDLSMNSQNGGNDAFIAKIEQALIHGADRVRPGGTLPFDIYASGDPGATYQLATALGTGPIRVGATRRIFLSADGLFFASVLGALPGVFVGYRGQVGADGRITASVRVPASNALVGLRLQSAFVTLDASAPQGIGTISNTLETEIR